MSIFLPKRKELDQDREGERPVRCLDSPQLIADIDDGQSDERWVDRLENRTQKARDACKLERRHQKPDDKGPYDGLSLPYFAAHHFSAQEIGKERGQHDCCREAREHNREAYARRRKCTDRLQRYRAEHLLRRDGGE